MPTSLPKTHALEVAIVAPADHTRAYLLIAFGFVIAAFAVIYPLLTGH